MTKGYTLWSPQAHLYNATICGQNGGAGIPYVALGFTGPVVWTNYGLPASWTNHAANIGRNVAGTAAASNADTGVYLQWHLTLNAGESTALSLLYTYGGVPRIRTPRILIRIGSRE